MTALTIGRIEAEISDPAGTEPRRVQQLLRRLADQALHERHAGLHGLSGEWCVRRLDLRLELDHAESDVAAAQRWADLIAAAVRDLVADGTSVLHYPTRSHGLTELATAIAAGSYERSWAWRQLGLLEAGDPDPQLDPGGALLAALGREPGLAVGVISYLVQRGSLRALDRLLGERGWVSLAALVRPDASASSPWPNRSADFEGQLPGAAARVAAIIADSILVAACRRESLVPSAPTVVAWATLAAAEVEPLRPQLGATVAVELAHILGPARAETEPETGTEPRINTEPDPHATLGRGIDHTEPAAIRQIESGHSVHDLAEPLDRTPAGPPHPGPPHPGRPHPGRPHPGRPHPGRPHPDQQRHPEHSAQPEPTRSPVPNQPAPRQPDVTGADATGADATGADATGAAATRDGHRRPERSQDPRRRPDDTTVEAATFAGLARLDHAESATPIAGPEPAEDARPAARTEWAGLLFLLNTAPAAGLPEIVDDDPRLAGRTLRWSLHQLAQRLAPIPAQDPAALALAGLAPDAAPPTGAEADAGEEAALAAQVVRWWAVTREALQQAARSAEDEAPATLWALGRRPGLLVADPGWLEVQLDLDGVDVTVRRAGLDLDPGWLAWLGMVVRFRYV